MNEAILSNEQVATFLAMTTTSKQQDHGTVPSVLDNVLGSLKVVRYENEKGIYSIEVERYKGVRLSKKTGKEIATFVAKDGSYRSLFVAQIQF